MLQDIFLAYRKIDAIQVAWATTNMRTTDFPRLESIRAAGTLPEGHTGDINSMSMLGKQMHSAWHSFKLVDPPLVSKEITLSAQTASGFNRKFRGSDPKTLITTTVAAIELPN